MKKLFWLQSWNDSDLQSRRRSSDSGNSFCRLDRVWLHRLKQLRTMATAPVQVGYVDKKDKIVTKDGSGRKAIAHRNGVTKLKKATLTKQAYPEKICKEFRFDNAEEYALAQEIKADIFAEGDHIDATASPKVRFPGRDQTSRTEQRTYDTWFQVPSSRWFQWCGI